MRIQFTNIFFIRNSFQFKQATFLPGQTRNANSVIFRVSIVLISILARAVLLQSVHHASCPTALALTVII